MGFRYLVLTFSMISYLRRDFDSLHTDDLRSFLGPFGAGKVLKKNQMPLPSIISLIHHTTRFWNFFFLRGVVTDRMDIFFCKLEISIKIILRKKKGVRYALIFKKSYFLKGIMNIGYILNSIYFFQWQSCNSSFMMNQHYWIKLNFSHSIEQLEEDSSYCISYIWDCKWWMNIFKI